MRKLTAIFDLDGVLVDNTETRRLNCTIPHEHNLFCEKIKKASAMPLCHLARLLGAAGVKIFIFTARSKTAAKTITESWLFDNNIPYYELLMREEGCNLPPHKLKEKMLKSFLAAHEGEDLGDIIAFEDDPKTCAMYSMNGVVAVMPFTITAKSAGRKL